MLPGGAAGLREVSDATKALREAAARDGVPASRVSNFIKDLDELRDAPNAGEWWTKRAKNHISTVKENAGRWGYVFEAEQAARLHRSGKLADMDKTIREVEVPWSTKGREVQVDMYATAPNGKRILVDAKSMRAPEGEISTSPALRKQMEAQAAAIDQKATVDNLEREMHWIVENPVADAVQKHAADMQAKYNVRIKFFERQGNEMPNPFVV